MVAVSCFFVALCQGDSLPVGHKIWGNTRIQLSENAPAGGFTDVLSGNIVDACDSSGGRGIPIADAFSSLPVAVLIN